MRRRLVVSLLIVFVATAVVASAAALEVRGPILQVLRYDVEPPAPAPEQRLVLSVYGMAGNSQNVKDTWSITSIAIPVGTTYEVAYSGHERPCPVDLDLDHGSYVGTGTGFIHGSAPHVLCVQHGQPNAPHLGVITISVAGEAVSVEALPVDRHSAVPPATSRIPGHAAIEPGDAGPLELPAEPPAKLDDDLTTSTEPEVPLTVVPGAADDERDTEERSERTSAGDQP